MSLVPDMAQAPGRPDEAKSTVLPKCSLEARADVGSLSPLLTARRDHGQRPSASVGHDRDRTRLRIRQKNS